MRNAFAFLPICQSFVSSHLHLLFTVVVVVVFLAFFLVRKSLSGYELDGDSKLMCCCCCCLYLSLFGSCVRECMMSLDMEMYAAVRPVSLRLVGLVSILLLLLFNRFSFVLCAYMYSYELRRISIYMSILVFAGTMHELVRVRAIPMFKANVNLFNGRGEKEELFKHQNKSKASTDISAYEATTQKKRQKKTVDSLGDCYFWATTGYINPEQK